ncbi:MAG: CDP-diacylglycerol--glycerol-3-phosphate 3-phosphatidyltransferase [Archangium sp.]|nr:CDP-diacylglycerol--glycerol-3-phosphate 3-phosphatidyltransferase [Archangium sp.]
MTTERETKQKLKQEARARKREEKQRKKEEKVARKVAKKAARNGRAPSVLLQEFWNLPNMLTVARIFMIPLFVWLLYDGDPWFSVMAASVFTIAAVTDVVDGFLARRWNMITVTGKLLDPMADKLIVAAALIMMVRLGRVPAWIVIVLLSREFIVNGLRQVAASEGLVIAAGQEGKWKTALQLAGIIALCIHYTHPVFLLVGTWDVNFNVVGKVLIYLSTAFSAWSAGAYFQAFLNRLGQRGQEQKSA